MALTLFEGRSRAFSFPGSPRILLSLFLLSIIVSSALSQRPYSAIGWGSNAGARLAENSSTTSVGPKLISFSSIVPSGKTSNVKAIMGGINYTTILLMDDNLVSLGANSNGELGLGTSSSVLSPPTYIPSFNVTKGRLRTTGTASFVLPPAGSSGPFYSWGLNTNYVAAPQLNKNTAILSPRVFTDFTTSNPIEAEILDISCSTVHCVTLFKNQTILGVGSAGSPPLTVAANILLPCNNSVNSKWCPFSITSIVDAQDIPTLISASDASTAIVTAKSNILIMGPLLGTSTLPLIIDTLIAAPSLLPPAPLSPPVSTPSVPITAPIPVTSPVPISTPTPPISAPPTTPLSTPTVSSSTPTLIPSNLPIGPANRVSTRILSPNAQGQNVDDDDDDDQGGSPSSPLVNALSDLARVIRVISVDNLHSSCQPANNGSINQIVSGSNFVLFLCNNSRVFGFGGNNAFQINPLQGSVISAAAPVQVDFSTINPNFYNDSNNKIVKIAAGPLSAYALTAAGHVYAWGSNENNALGTISTAATTSIANLSDSNVSNLPSVIPSGHTIVDISAHLSVTGAYLRTAEKPGTSCPDLGDLTPFMYCTPSGTWTFSSATMSSGSYTLPRGLSMAGNMTLNGNVFLHAPFGLAMEGELDVGGSASVALESENTIIGDVTLGDVAAMTVSDGQLLVTNGNIAVGASSTLTLSNMNFTSGSSKREASTDSATVVSSGAIVIEGNVTIIIPSSVIDELLTAGANGKNRNLNTSTIAIYAEGGLIFANASSSSNSTAKRFVEEFLQKNATGSSNSTGSSITIKPSTSSVSSCQKIVSSSKSTSTTLLVFVSLDSSDCNSKNSGGLSRRDLGIILGCVFGAVVIIVAAIIIVLYNSPSLKRKYLPFRNSRM